MLAIPQAVLQLCRWLQRDIAETAGVLVRTDDEGKRPVAFGCARTMTNEAEIYEPSWGQRSD